MMRDGNGYHSAHRKGETAKRLGLGTGECGKFIDVEASQVWLSDGLAHVGGLCLHRLFAHFGEVTGFVDHAAQLTAHADGTRFAGILAAHALIQRDGSNRPSLGEHVLHCRKSTGCFHSRRHHDPKLTPEAPDSAYV